MDAPAGAFPPNITENAHPALTERKWAQLSGCRSTFQKSCPEEGCGSLDALVCLAQPGKQLRIKLLWVSDPHAMRHHAVPCAGLLKASLRRDAFPFYAHVHPASRHLENPELPVPAQQIDIGLVRPNRNVRTKLADALYQPVIRRAPPGALAGKMPVNCLRAGQSWRSPVSAARRSPWRAPAPGESPA